MASFLQKLSNTKIWTTKQSIQTICDLTPFKHSFVGYCKFTAEVTDVDFL